MIRMTLYSSFCQLALLQIYAERLVGEYVLAGIQSGFDLPAMLGGSGYDGNRVNVSLFQHFAVVGVQIGDAQFVLCVFQLCRNDGAGSGQGCVRNLESDVVCVYLAETAESGDANFDGFHIQIPPSLFVRNDELSAFLKRFVFC